MNPSIVKRCLVGADACHQLPRWVYVKGVFNQGLDNRRAREMAWCLKGV